MKCNVILLVAGLMMLGCGKSAEEEAAGPSGAGDEKGAEKGVAGLYGNENEKLHLHEDGTAEFNQGGDDFDCFWKLVDGEIHVTRTGDRGGWGDLKSRAFVVNEDGGLTWIADIPTAASGKKRMTVEELFKGQKYTLKDITLEKIR
jgi:hypothetical protein